MATYPTLDYLDDLTPAEMAAATPLTLAPMANSNLWDLRASITGSNSNALSHHLYRFTATAGKSYDLFSLSALDPFLLRAYDQFGNAIVANDEADDGPPVVLDGIAYPQDVIFDWVAPYTGTFYVAASWNQSTTDRLYNLSIYQDRSTTLPPPNRAPIVAAPVADQDFREGVNVTFTIPATAFTDPDAQALTYSATLSSGQPLPSWLSFNASTRTFSGMAPLFSSDLTVRITARDPAGLSVSDDVVLRTPSDLFGSSQPPRVVNPIGGLDWTEGFQLFFISPAGDIVDPDSTLTFSAAQADGSRLPSWLSFDPATRKFSGTAPLDSPTYVVRLTATESTLFAFGDPPRSVYDQFTIFTPSPSRVPSSGRDLITGTSGNDRINALAANDSIDGLAGDDVLTGGPGADTIIGGSGTDTAVFEGVSVDFLISRASDGTVRVADKRGEQDVLTGIENLQFTDATLTTASQRYLPMYTDPVFGGSQPIYRFYNVRDKAFFYTSSASERDNVIRESTDPSFNPANGVWPYFYQGATFGTPGSGGGALPVYRFYNTKTGHHFFTTSESERQLVIRESTDPAYTPANGVWPFVDEGIAYYAYAASSSSSASGGRDPVYRFYSPVLDRHFFTADDGEAAGIRLTGQWNDEGVAYRAPTEG